VSALPPFYVYVDESGDEGFSFDRNKIAGQALTGLQITPAELHLRAGETYSFVATALRGDAGSDVTGQAAWSSSDPTVITVEAGGHARGLAAGTATISASYLGAVASPR
jgi:uncharacterized protein YjdB